MEKGIIAIDELEIAELLRERSKQVDEALGISLEERIAQVIGAAGFANLRRPEYTDFGSDVNTEMHLPIAFVPHRVQN